jgi:hypothetical protein
LLLDRQEAGNARDTTRLCAALRHPHLRPLQRCSNYPYRHVGSPFF